MEAISLKLDETMLQNIDSNLKENNYSTRTEFIRDAIRVKLEELKKENLIREFMGFKGKAKKQTTDEENRQTRKQVGEELIQELEKRFR